MEITEKDILSLYSWTSQQSWLENLKNFEKKNLEQLSLSKQCYIKSKTYVWSLKLKRSRSFFVHIWIYEYQINWTILLKNYDKK